MFVFVTSLIRKVQSRRPYRYLPPCTIAIHTTKRFYSIRYPNCTLVVLNLTLAGVHRSHDVMTIDQCRVSCRPIAWQILYAGTRTVLHKFTVLIQCIIEALDVQHETKDSHPGLFTAVKQSGFHEASSDKSRLGRKEFLSSIHKNPEPAFCSRTRHSVTLLVPRTTGTACHLRIRNYYDDIGYSPAYVD